MVAGGQQRVNPDGTDSDGSSELYRLDQHGRQLGAPIPTFGSYSSPACPTYPPSSVRVSPDGQTIAYWILNCGSFDYSTYFTPATSTGLSFPHQTTGQMDYINPVWLDSNTLLVNHNGATFGPQPVALREIAVADDSTAGGPVVLGDSDSLTSFQATVDRAGHRLAFFEDDHASWTDGKPRTAKLLLYTTNGSALAEPTLRCTSDPGRGRVLRPVARQPELLVGRQRAGVRDGRRDPRALDGQPGRLRQRHRPAGGARRGDAVHRQGRPGAAAERGPDGGVRGHPLRPHA